MFEWCCLAVLGLMAVVQGMAVLISWKIMSMVYQDVIRVRRELREMGREV